MSILTNDPMTQLAFSVYENRGVFALLLGSGLSRSAEIPTGWEITLDLVRRVAEAQGVEAQPDWAAWHRDKTGEEPSYSKLLEELASSPDERRSILHSYIEPTEEDREEGRKIPTAAHRAIAGLVRRGFIRVIITTNFDRLMENALREVGVEPTVVSSTDALKGAEPITHSACYILKLHGDYKDARILNTDSELSGYPSEYDNLLDRIFDEFGLIVAGWSGEWDHALRAALLRAPNRRYPLFWAKRGENGSGAQELIEHRKSRILDITDADSFFSALAERVETLEKSHRQNPHSVDLLVNTAKRYLSKPEHRIQLDELLAEEARRLLTILDGPSLRPEGSWSVEEFRARVAEYEAAAEPLAKMAGVLGRWGDGADLPIILDIIRSIWANADNALGGLNVWLYIRSYPAVLIFTAYGIGLTRARRWKELSTLFNSTVSRRYHEPERVVEIMFLTYWVGGDNDYWKHLEGHDRKRTPLSDHLLDVFESWSQSFVGAVSGIEVLFSTFEVLASISYLNPGDAAQIEASLDGQNWVRMPVGRSYWHREVRDLVLKEIRDEKMKSELLNAGFARGDEKHFDVAIRNFERIASRSHW